MDIPQAFGRIGAMKKRIRETAVPFAVAAFFFIVGLGINGRQGFGQEPAPAPADQPAAQPAAGEQPAAPAPAPAEQPAAEQQPGAEEQAPAEETPRPEEPFAVIPSEDLQEDPADFPFDVSIEYADGYFFPYQDAGRPRGSVIRTEEDLCAEVSTTLRVHGELLSNGVNRNVSLSLKMEAYSMTADGEKETLASRRFVDTVKAFELDRRRELVLAHRFCPRVRRPNWVWRACVGPIWVDISLGGEDTRMRGQNLTNNRYSLKITPPLYNSEACGGPH